MIVCWNGHLIEGGEFSLRVSDGVFLRGEGVFETIRADKGEPCLWNQHFERLAYSAEKLGLKIPDRLVLQERIGRVIVANQLLSAKLRLTLGEGCLISAEPLPKERGEIHVVTSNCPINEKSPLAQIKCTSYAENMFLLRESGVDEVIRPNTRGEICEGCISNLFFVKTGIIYTPSLQTGCLPGVMRQEVMRHIEVREVEWAMADLKSCDEIWLSNALRRLRAVTSINGRNLAQPSELFSKALVSVKA
jgi:branched-subunit amino acid aminotransferase/4-amino-4-deoxychorismate lyase